MASNGIPHAFMRDYKKDMKLGEIGGVHAADRHQLQFSIDKFQKIVSKSPIVVDLPDFSSSLQT